MAGWMVSVACDDREVVLLDGLEGWTCCEVVGVSHETLGTGSGFEVVGVEEYVRYRSEDERIVLTGVGDAVCGFGERKYGDGDKIWGVKVLGLMLEGERVGVRRLVGGSGSRRARHHNEVGRG